MSNPLPHFFNILVAPADTLTNLRERPRFYYPFIAVLFAQALVVVVYFQAVDLEWLGEYMAAALPDDMPSQAREDVAAFNRAISPTLMTTFGIVSIVIIFSLFWAISAGYLTLVSSLRSDNIRFGQWLGLECWAAVPMILVALASLITIWLNDDGQLAQDRLNPFSLNSLIFHRGMGEPGANLLNTIDLSLIWGAFIKVIGFRTWTGASSGTVAAIVLAPYLVIFGAWTLIAFT
ncbi:MAG: YIP1 family protein [Cellvibrionaceae bacterium]